MAEYEEYIERMRATIFDADEAGAIAAAEAALAAGVPPLKALEEGFASAIREQGEAFHQMEIFLPELILSAKAMQAGLTVIEPVLKADEIGRAHV